MNDAGDRIDAHPAGRLSRLAARRSISRKRGADRARSASISRRAGIARPRGDSEIRFIARHEIIKCRAEYDAYVRAGAIRKERVARP